MKLELKTEGLAACLLHVATADEVRAYLQGVLVEVKGPHIFTVATDGATLAAYQHHDIEAAEDCDGLYLIPADYVADVVKAAKKNKADVVTFEPDPADSRRFVLGVPGGPLTVTGHLMDGRFPDWRRVVPKAVSGLPGQLDPMLLARIGKMDKLFGRKRSASASIVHLHNGAAPNAGAHVFLFRKCPACFALVMPFRFTDTDVDTVMGSSTGFEAAVGTMPRIEAPADQDGAE